MKLRVLVLALMALMIINCVLVEAEPQLFPTPKQPTITTSTTPTPKTTITTNTTTTTSQTTSSTPPLPTSSALPSKQPVQSSQPISTPPLTPTTSTPQVTPSPSVQPNPPNSCSKSNRVCPDPGMFCNVSLKICQPKGALGDSCNNNSECLNPFVCSKNGCQYNNSGDKNDNHYNIKKVAIIGAIVVGTSGVCGLIFFVYRKFKNRNDYDITSRLYSTDDDISEPDPYPFNERSNSFSNNAMQQPSRAPPPKAHYDNLPPARNRGFAAPHQGYNNYYNEFNNNNEGRYMRQNENGNVTRTMNLLQQTRGNVVVTPPPPHWNPPPVQQPQGGLFPIPSVKGNYGVPIPPNNMKNFNKNNNNSSDNLNHNQPKASSSYSVDYSVNRNNQHVNSTTLPPKENDSSTLPVPSTSKQKTSSMNRDSFFDYYARDSFLAKTLENKLPIFKRNKNNQDTSAMVHDTSSRIQTFGYDSK